MEDHHISNAVIDRLPRYYRYLGLLLEEKTERISSLQLSRIMNVTASQIRQDLNHFGGFGQQGYGYNVSYLYEEIGKILGLDKTYQTIIIGAGNLGQALANYVRFEKRGFRVIGLFDKDEEKAGKTVRNLTVQMISTLPDFLEKNPVDIAILTLPAAGAQEVCSVLAGCNVRAIWNFAHTDLKVPENMIVENVHLSESLMKLSYRINERYGEDI